MTFAFVADYGLPRSYYEDPVLAYNDEVLHDTGSKITIIEDPFGLNGGAKVLGATVPIPDAFFTDVTIDAAGQKLYVLAPGANTIIVYDLKKLEAQALAPTDFGLSFNTHVYPLDPDAIGLNGILGFGTLTDPGINIDRSARGVSLDNVSTLTLNGPTTTVDVSSATPQPLVFDWTINETLLGSSNADPSDTGWLYISAEAPGQGLWPNDPARARPAITNSGDLSTLLPNQDGDPGRIFTQSTFLGLDGELHQGFQPGHAYEILANGDIKEITDPTLAPGETRVTLDPVFAHVLTAGQSFYWGVEVNGTEDRQSASFRTAPVKTTSSYGVVTVLTDGFEFNGGNGLAPSQALLGNQIAGSDALQTPQEFIALAKLILQAEGGGVILEYNKSTGQWNDALNPSNTATGAELLQANKAVVLISDWTFESDITDSGFSEAAADAIFAALVDLDRQTNYTLLGANPTTQGGNASPIQFIGYGRGATVDSEIVQRFDQYFVHITDISVTSLNPTGTNSNSASTSNSNQPTLNIPLQQIINGIEAISVTAQIAATSGIAVSLTAGVALTAFTENPAFLELAAEVIESLTAIINNLAILNKTIEALNFTLGLFDVFINPIQFGTGFNDKPVVRWSNEQFADTYYQTGALEQFAMPSQNLSNTAGNFSLTGSVSGKNGNTPTSVRIPVIPTYTFTPNGQPDDASLQNIDISLNMLSGFGHDDFPNGLTGFGTPFGLGGASQDVLDWYAGTIKTSQQTFDAGPIDRRLSDTGLRDTVYGFGIGLPLDKSEEFNSTGWYAVDPAAVAGNKAYTTIGSITDPYQPTASFVGPTAALIKADGNIKQEGIGTGFFYGPGGGGQAYDPQAGLSAQGHVSASLTASPDGSGNPPELQPLASVFNGDFELGDNQSLVTYLFAAGNPIYSAISNKLTGGSLSSISSPAGRFPISYSLPGWSAQQGR